MIKLRSLPLGDYLGPKCYLDPFNREYFDYTEEKDM